MNQDQPRRNELAIDIVERGNQALVAALGPQAAIEYMKQLSRELPTDEARDGVERVSFALKPDQQTGEVVVEISQLVRWLRLKPEAALQFANHLARLARALMAGRA